MILKKLIPLVLLLLTLSSNAQLQLTEASEISVLSIGPGYLLNDSFGHSAIRVKDPLYNFDVVYDYGRYDFEAEGFYLNFAQGKLNYMIGRTEFEDFLSFYEYQNRRVQEQQLNLSTKQKTAFYYFLTENIKPENQSYPYDFFYNNCATKITDAIESILEDQITYLPPSTFEQDTFRNLIRSDLNQNSWGSLGIDVALGSKIDQLASVKEHLFLPKNLYLLLENAQIGSTDLKIVKKSKILTSSSFVKTFEGFGSPLAILSLIAFAILFVTFRDHKKNKRSKWLDVSLFAFTGLIGLALLLLWFATDHTATSDNYNLLWAFATNLLFIPSILKTRLNNRGIKYIVFLVILLALMMLHWITGVQSFAIGLIPLLIAICVRYLFLIRHFNKAIRL
ncbi:MAG: DUF4105 domain-containing protein [Flavobacteriaceae bacterium]|jgi:hypothetical protein|nr:DUF4105 domain-containing protein [Flavobacteriaceae bacterium]|tara:strand:- start:171 stop:1349 length:1179 start_codon:yes stop_codon:yes gene_type:complete